MLGAMLAMLFDNQWLVFGAALALLLALAELGARMGRATRRRAPEAASSHSSSVQGAVLGLMGLLLGFTFAMAIGRLNTRAALIVDEANAIGTTWLRADLLPDEHRTGVRDLLAKYTRAKLALFGAATDEEAVQRDRQELAQLQTALWRHATAATTARPTTATSSFVTALNETFDLDASRRAAMLSHVPTAVWLLLLLVSCCGAWSCGYGSGSNGLRSAFNQRVFPALIAVVLTLIMDIDHPRSGLITTNQQPLVDLLASM